MLRALPTWIIAPLALILGFGVADVTGVRPLGGIVLFLGALWCGLRWRRARGLPVALGLVAVFLVAFGVSHPLGHEIGSWPSVFVVSAVVGIVVFWAMRRADGLMPPVLAPHSSAVICSSRCGRAS